MHESSHTIRSALAPGPNLDEMNQRMGRRALIESEGLLNGPSKQIGLLGWARHIVTQASSCGCVVYGMQHPYLDPEVDKAFW
jgi:hypothetical protein